MEIFKKSYTKKDGRTWIQYDNKAFPESSSTQVDKSFQRPDNWDSPHLRYNSMRDEWVAISASRQNRPQLPSNCPLCPGSDGKGSEVPNSGANYRWAVFENMFPALHGKTGKCEVVLYANDHDQKLGDCETEHIEGLVEVWKDRSYQLGQVEGFRQVFIFENKGEEIGVTLHHPHGQIYAFNEIPPFLSKEQNASRAHYEAHDECLICSIREKESNAASRIVLENDDLLCWVPEAARYPYELHLTTKRHRPLIESLDDQETRSVAEFIKKIIAIYNSLFDFEMPYIMVHHQAPSDDPNCLHYHWHMEFYPPYRSAKKLKYLAGSESGCGFFINDTFPEEKAEELRKAAKNLSF